MSGGTDRWPKIVINTPAYDPDENPLPPWGACLEPEWGGLDYESVFKINRKTERWEWKGKPGEEGQLLLKDPFFPGAFVQFGFAHKNRGERDSFEIRRVEERDGRQILGERVYSPDEMIAILEYEEHENNQAIEAAAEHRGGLRRYIRLIDRHKITADEIAAARADPESLNTVRQTVIVATPAYDADRFPLPPWGAFADVVFDPGETIHTQESDRIRWEGEPGQPGRLVMQVKEGEYVQYGFAHAEQEDRAGFAFWRAGDDRGRMALEGPLDRDEAIAWIGEEFEKEAEFTPRNKIMKKVLRLEDKYGFSEKEIEEERWDMKMEKEYRQMEREQDQIERAAMVS